jgi:MutS domain V
MHQVNLEALERLGRRWQHIPLRHSLRPDPLHLYAADLDLFGHASLLHLLDTTTTWMGQATLVRWLLDASPVERVRERQRAMSELVPHLDFRQQLQVRGGPDQTPRPDPAPLLTWAEAAPWLRQRPALRWAARLSPVCLCVLGALQAAGVVSPPWWLAFLLVNAVVWQLAGKQAYATLSRVNTQESAFRHYAASFELLSTASSLFTVPSLERLLPGLTADGRSAYAHMRRLERIMRFVLPRSALVYWAVQSVFLWDVHVLAALEDWQGRAGGRVRAWLETLGEIEALASLAQLGHAHPEWAVPDLDPNACQLHADRAGHPLIAPERRVDNDVALGPPRTFLLVTGSNMAGKSTYLRTIGANIVLAQAGGPVCARAFRMPPLALSTSMRVVDSLEHGVSTFLAEVLRLKQIVDASREPVQGQRTCFLLDEILQGTNTAERQIAARRVIRFLLARGAIGAVSTHDLTLADAPEFAEAAQPVHFSETLTTTPDGPLMTFDYHLEPGLATSTNALRLLEILGLGTDEP